MNLEMQLQFVLDHGVCHHNKWVSLRHGAKGQSHVVAIEHAEAIHEFASLTKVGLVESKSTVDGFEIGGRVYRVEMVGFRNPRVRVCPASDLSMLVAQNKGLGGVVFCQFNPCTTEPQ